MTHTTKHRTASGSRSPAALSNQIVEELYRYATFATYDPSLSTLPDYVE